MQEGGRLGAFWQRRELTCPFSCQVEGSPGGGLLKKGWQTDVMFRDGPTASLEVRKLLPLAVLGGVGPS